MIKKKYELEYLKLNLEELSDDKVRHLIFGKNGTGKTTFSRNVSPTSKKIDKLIFNVDYINNNIYQNKDDSDEVKVSTDSPKTSEATYNIFIGNGISELMMKKTTYNKERLDLNKEIKELLKIKEDIFNDLNQFNIILKMPTKYDEVDLDLISKAKKLSKTKKEEIKQSIDRIISVGKINTIISKYNGIIIDIKLLNEDIKEFNKIYDNNEIDAISFKINDTAGKSDRTKVIWIGKEYNVSEIKEYLKTISDRKNKLIKSIEKFKKTISQSFAELKNDSNFSDVKKDKDFTTLLGTKLNIVEKSVNNLKVEDSKKMIAVKNLVEIKPINKNEIIMKLSDLVEKNIYSFFKSPVKIFDLCKKISEINKLIEENNTEILKVSQLKIENFSNKMNKHLSSLGEEKLKIKNIPSSAKYKISLKYKMMNKEISKLSEGEKKSLALSYFLTDLEMNISSFENDFVIVIDDPFDSNDHHKSDKLLKIKFDYNGEKLNIFDFIENKAKEKGLKFNIILTTHNISLIASIGYWAKDPQPKNGDRFFAKLKDDFIEKTELLELVKDDKESSLKKMKMQLLLPKEFTILKWLEKTLVKNLDNDKAVDEIRTMLLLLIRSYDIVDPIRRNNIANIIKGKWERYSSLPPKRIIEAAKRAGLNLTEKIAKEISVKNTEPYFSFDKENIIECVKLEDMEDLYEYIDIFLKRINSIIEAGTKEQINRYKHKNNYHYSVVGYAIEE